MVGLSRDPRTMPQAGKLRAVIDDIDHDFEQAVRSFFAFIYARASSIKITRFATYRLSF